MTMSSMIGPVRIPDGAKCADAEVSDDGSMIVRWQGSLYNDSDEPDRWTVTVPPDGRTVYVRADVETWGWSREVRDTVREMFPYDSGISIELCMAWTA
ncbi:hypothetical protein A5773_13015 [Mycobacterium sp. 852014-52450_SCH5900713]|nr:hypothetical protein A5773_13015 [Mycobacterium sp. 852014-52450_SCH5900713]